MGDRKLRDPLEASMPMVWLLRLVAGLNESTAGPSLAIGLIVLLRAAEDSACRSGICVEGRTWWRCWHAKIGVP